ncbi:hypothetical protein M9H77_36667 [Catharanthus roseus]|uniref:Uncharacterized protein n=1 Tax=Catharanthus roseus TaxID=4058 RepID=A0ACB9ZSF7_CATRO|nr:hypothetical protein M9H77_36667 [Catharanthus roseus]
MPSFCPVLVMELLLIMASLVSLSSCEYHHQLIKMDIIPSTTTTISSAPANPPHESPFTQLSPDIAPLLPSPGGVVPSPTGSSIPTIPSTPSPPNPDGFVGVGPDSAFAPLGSFLPDSSAVRFSSLTGSSKVVKLFSFISYCYISLVF